MSAENAQGHAIFCGSSNRLVWVSFRKRERGRSKQTQSLRLKPFFPLPSFLCLLVILFYFLNLFQKEAEVEQGPKNPCILKQELGCPRHARMLGEGCDVTSLCPVFLIEIWVALQRHKNVKGRVVLCFINLLLATLLVNYAATSSVAINIYHF